MDVPDVNPFDSKNVPISQKEEEDPIKVSGFREPDSEYYDFNHKHRGIALIFNHTKFKSAQKLSQRDGSDKDCADLVRVLEIMKFEVTPCINFTKAQVEKKLDDGKNL